MTTQHMPVEEIDKQKFVMSVKSFVGLIISIILATASLIAYVRTSDSAINQCVQANTTDIRVLEQKQLNTVKILEDFKSDQRNHLNRIEGKLDKLLQP